MNLKLIKRRKTSSSLGLSPLVKMIFLVWYLLQMSCLMRSLFLYFIRSINILAIVWRLCVFAFIQYYNIYFIYMSYTSLFSLLSSSLLLIPLFLSVSPWNGHLRLSALSGMSGTQLSSHGEEGELGRRMRGECYFKSPAQSPRKDQSE